MQLPSFSKAETQGDIESLWSMYEDEKLDKVGKIGSESIFIHRTTDYITLFLVKKDTPTFYVSLARLLSPRGWKIDYVIKNKSSVSYQKILETLVDRFVEIYSDFEQTKEAMGVWKKMINTKKYNVSYYSTSARSLVPKPDNLWSNPDIAIKLSKGV